MAKEVNATPKAKQAWLVALEALPDPGEGKKLILFVRASSVSLRIVEDTSTIKGQEPESGEVG